MERHVTREDLEELKEDIKALENKVDDLSAAIARIELKLAETQAASNLKTAAEQARLELELANQKVELQKYKGNARAEIGNISTKTAIILSVLGSIGTILIAAWVTTMIQKLFGVKP